MLGFIVGTACLIGLFKVARHGCGDGYGRWGHGWHRGGWGGWMLRGISARLDATPAQEKAIREAMENLRNAFEKLHDEKRKARRDVAAAFRGAEFDHGPMKDAFTRHDQILEDIQRTILVELSKVHEALDERQRREVADMFENGFYGHHRWHGRWGHHGCRSFSSASMA